MSRRKQEKPQPRKNIVSFKEEVAELAQDILTCGVCRRTFPLCEIVRFIQHKVNVCNKENNCLNKLFGVPPDDSDSEDSFLALSPKKPSALTNESSTHKPAKDELVPEPCTYICSTCRQSHSSAWALLQHVQKIHGLDLYVDFTPTEILNGEENSLQAKMEHAATRAPLLERQLDQQSIPRPSSHDIFSLPALPSVQSSPPPLIEVHHLDSSPPNSSLGTSAEPHLDFYSQRLRQLAGATSPNAFESPSKLLQSSFKAVVQDEPINSSPNSNNSNNNSNNNSINNEHSQSQQSINITPPQLAQSSASSTASENALSPKHNPKACEFCGKTFRFMSNLIVHRRSHTGEKPFKCHICNHACTQASKLKRHMKTHKRRKKMDKHLTLNRLMGKNGMQNNDGFECLKKTLENHTNGEREYPLDDFRNNEDDMEDEDEEEIDVEDDNDDDDDIDTYKKLTVDLGSDENMVAEDLSKKPLKNGTVDNNGVSKEVSKESDNNTIRHSLLSEVMEKIGLSSIQQYNEAYKQALKESSSVKQEGHSDGGSSSNDAANYFDRTTREGTRSAGQSPLSFNTGLLSAFDQSLGLKRIKLEDNWRDKEDNLYAGLWIPSVSSHSMSSYKDLYSSDGSDRRKSKTDGALNCGSPRSSSPRPGPSSSLLLGISTHNSLLKPKDQRRNDTCEFCGKVFKNCSNLTVHRRSHTGEKPYKCELCSYACAQSSKLTRHMKTHGRLGKDVYRCRFCDMPFSVPSTLEKHMRKCVVSQSGGNSSYLLSERESDSKEMTS